MQDSYPQVLAFRLSDPVDRSISPHAESSDLPVLIDQQVELHRYLCMYRPWKLLFIKLSVRLSLLLGNLPPGQHPGQAERSDPTA